VHPPGAGMLSSLLQLLVTSHFALGLLSEWRGTMLASCLPVGFAHRKMWVCFLL
jgi:hypothetical protein